MRSKIFKSGNSLAVRIPKELQYSTGTQDVEIEKKGDALIIRPVQKRSLASLMKKFAAFPSDFMKEGREQHKESKRKGWK